MKNNLRKKGFTIVELMVGMIIASILSLIIGSMLYYTYLSWFRSRDTVELQRDATIAMDMIARTIRPHPGSAITANGGQVLTAGNQSFYVTGNSLWYDPDTAVSGDETEIVKNKLDASTPPAFTKFDASHFVSVDMTLKDNSGSMAIHSTINYRE